MSQEFRLGIDIGASKTALVVIDNNNKVVAGDRFPTHEFYDNWFLEVDQHIQTIQKNYPLKTIGIGIAGQVDSQGVLLHAPNLGWNQLPLAEIFSRHYEVPTMMLNDVRAAAWAEWHLGAGKGHQNFVVMMIGTGIGGALIAGGQLITGNNHSAGELGHMIVGGSGPRCSCGNEGCLEAQSGGWAIAERYGAENAADVISHYKKGDKKAAKIIDDVYEGLLRGCLTIVHAFNPELILLGGGIIEALPDIPQWLKENIEEKALKAASKNLKIKRIELGEGAVAIGSAHYANAKM